MSNGTVVPRHWIVALYSPNLTGTTSTADPYGIGTMSIANNGQLYGVLLDAQNAAKQFAAASPGAIYVVYEAEWWAQVNITPVNLYPVMAQVMT